jgi:hypothetical protein
MTTSLSLEPNIATETPGEIPADGCTVNLPFIGRILFKLLLIAIGLLAGSFFGLLTALFSGLVQFTC